MSLVGGIVGSGLSPLARDRPTTEHRRSDSAEVQCHLPRVAYRSDPTSPPGASVKSTSLAAERNSEVVGAASAVTGRCESTTGQRNKCKDEKKKKKKSFMNEDRSSSFSELLYTHIHTPHPHLDSQSMLKQVSFHNRYALSEVID
eukprot:GHVL01008104.1.p1 GENE.GHVL01008104.1~~GHVL01008104.1.p1  ORF type:complete len:145 (+),score=14.82 GHVL01008104.1:778-1212(+)